MRFAEALERVKKKYHGADEELDKLIGTRTNMIIRKLREVKDDTDSDTEISLTDGETNDIP